MTANNNKRSNDQVAQSQQRPRKMQRIIMSSLPDRMLAKNTMTSKSTSSCEECSPDTTVAQVLAQQEQKVVVRPYSDCTGFFHAPTQAEIDAYDHEALAAIRTQNMDTLRQFHADGRPLKCSNKFGESLLHMACRKGMTEVTTFLVKDAQVPFAVCDDYGRTPLHDACWAHTLNLELIDFILSDCPDLLYIQDKRGNTALSYLRREKWAAWNKYVQGKSADFLKPKQLD